MASSSPSRDHVADPIFERRLSVLVEPAGAGSQGRGIFFHAAREVTASDIVMMTSQGGICTVTINEPLAMRLGLSPQHPPAPGEEPYYANSVEARACAATGISAEERALTMRTIGDKNVSAEQLVSPGHIMVQVARNVLRAGASLSELANLFLAASSDTRFSGWSDILDHRGDLASEDQCRTIADVLGLPVYNSAVVGGVGRARLKVWTDLVEFSSEKFGRPA